MRGKEGQKEDAERTQRGQSGEWWERERVGE